jgi:hypothetical protein
MRLDRYGFQRALGVLIAGRLLLVAGCSSYESEVDPPGMVPSTIGAATEGAAGEGDELDEGEGEARVAGDGDPQHGMAGGPAAGSGATVLEPAPEPGSFGEVYALLATTCGGGRSGCHIGGASAMLGLPDVDAAYERLVGVPSLRCAGKVLVTPGDADASILVMALEGGSECVKAMPLGRERLADEDVSLVRAWIDAGAHRD